MAKNKGCVNCKYFKTHKMDSAECYECTNKSAWKTTADAVFGKIIVTLCNELNKKYDPHIKNFGTEAWKKVAHLAITTAS